VVGQSITCSSISIGDPEDFANRSRAVLEATQAFGIEEALVSGVAQSTNPFLGDGNVNILSPAAVSPQIGLSLLEKAIGQTGRSGLIHAPPEIVSAWSFDGGIQTDGIDMETWLGTSIAVGGGYIGAEANFIAPGAGNAWAFATGPVEIRMSDIQLVGPDGLVSSMDVLTNLVEFRSERYVLAVWDTCLQSAVLIDYT
jgi:hypothetical protein